MKRREETAFCGLLFSFTFFIDWIFKARSVTYKHVVSIIYKYFLNKNTQKIHFYIACSCHICYSINDIFTQRRGIEMIQRRSIAMCIVLSLVTCGIYGIYWFICLTNDCNAVSNDPDGTSGGVAFLLTLITCGIYGL